MRKYRVEVTEQVTYMFEMQITDDAADEREEAFQIWESKAQPDRELEWMVDGKVTEFHVIRDILKREEGDDETSI